MWRGMDDDLFLSVDPEYCLDGISVDREIDEKSPKTGALWGKWPARQDSNLQPTA